MSLPAWRAARASLRAAALLSAALFVNAASAQTNLLQNGSFESSFFNDATAEAQGIGYVSAPPNPSSGRATVPSWTWGAGAGVSTFALNRTGGALGLSAQEGSYAVSFGTGSASAGGSISQTFNVSSGARCTVRFYVRRIGGGQGIAARVAVTNAATNASATLVDGAGNQHLSGYAVPMPVASGVWTEVKLTFVAPATVMRFTFTDLSTSADSTDLGLDNVSIQQKTLQTLNFLGGVGSQGQIAANTEFSRDGVNWAPAYLSGNHPWGNLPGTTSWINRDPSPFVGLNETTDFRIRFNLPADFEGGSMTFRVNADNIGEMIINGHVLATTYGGYSPSQYTVDGSSLLPGQVNTLNVRLTDQGGWVGINYVLTLTGYSSSAPEVVVLPPVLTSSAAASGTVGQPFVFNVTAGNNPTSFASSALPAGLSLNSATGLISGTPTTMGTYPVTLSVSNSGGSTTSNLTITINKGTATVTLTNTTHTYDGTQKAASATTNPSGLAVDFSYSPDSRINVGSYSILAAVNNPNYSGSRTGTLVIQAAPFTVSFGQKSFVYDGTPKAVPYTTIPANANTRVAYNSSSTVPTNAGNYSVQVSAADGNWTGSSSTTMTIAQAPLTITLGNLRQTYTGTARQVTYATSPSGQGALVYYNGVLNGSAVNAGNHTITASALSTNYVGNATAVLTIDPAPVAISLSNLVHEYDGNPKSVTVSTTPSIATTVLYGNSTTAPAAVGNYTVTATSNNPNYTGQATSTLRIQDTVPPVIAVEGVTYSAIPLANPSFQGPVTTYWDAAIDSWTMTSPSGAGVMSVVAMSGTFTGNKAPHGNQVLWINSGSVYQNTATTIQAGRTYVFSGYVGMRTDQPGGAGGRGSVSLQTTDGTVLAKVISSTLAPGQFMPINVAYAVPAGSPTVGKTLRVVLNNETTNLQVNFDAFSLAETSTLVFDATTAAGATVTFLGEAIDNVSGNVPVTFSPTSGSVLPVGNYIATAGAQDAAGNKASLIFGVIVQDKVAPVISAPADVVAEATTAAGAAVSFTATAADGIDGSVAVTATPASGSVFRLGDTEVLLTAKDKSGNTSTASFTVTVRDTTAPSLTLPADIVAPATSAAGANVSFSVTASDAVTASPELTYSAAPGALFPIGTTEVSVTAKDAAGNATTRSFQITVTDTVAPVISVPADLTVEAVDGNGAAVSFSATATDNIDGTVGVTATPESGSVFPLGATTVSLSARDNAGNPASATFTVRVVDTTAPALTIPADQVLEATSAAGAVAAYTATATDAVSAAQIEYSVAPGATFALGTTTVNVTAQDAAGNTSSGAFTITVRDTTAPVISAPADQTVEATSGTGALVTFAAQANDLVDGAVTVSASPASGSTFALGTTTVTLSATDAAGNASSSTFTVTVRDTTAPTLSVPASQVIEAASGAGAVATFVAGATDAVSAATITYSVASGSTFALGTTTVTVTATDAAGNAASDTFTITVVDTTAPVLTVPSNQVLEATSAAGAVATFAASATDLVTASPAVTYSVAPVSTFAIGTTTVTVTAKDAAGNATSGTFTVTVRDTTAPVLGSVSAMPNTLWPPNKKMVPVVITAPVTDAVGATAKIVAVTTNEPDGTTQWQVTSDLTLNVKSDRKGGGSGRIYTITVEATDAAGNATRSTVTVTVPHDQRK